MSAIAIVTSIVNGVTNTGGVNGNEFGYLLDLGYSASSGGPSFGEHIGIFIPNGTNRSHFNDIIIQAIINQVQSVHSVTLQGRDIFFQSFDNG